MGLNAEQLRTLVVRPALKTIGLWSPAAENLVMGTAAQESGLRHLHQLKGPAVGLWQIEPATYRDIWERYLPSRPALSNDLRRWAGGGNPANNVIPSVELMHGNLFFAAAMCRVFFLRIPQPLPAADDVEALGKYWKTFYNTNLGRGTVAQFIQSYELVA